MLALRPWHGLDFDAAGGAIHAAHGVGERDRDVPDRDELEFARAGHAVVSGARLPAAGADGLAVGPWDDLGDQTLPDSAGSSMLYPAGQTPNEEWPPNRMEEKVAHNSPLLRRVTDPFSKRTIVDNFQEAHAASRRSGTGFHPQFCRKRQIFNGGFPHQSIIG